MLPVDALKEGKGWQRGQEDRSGVGVMGEVLGDFFPLISSPVS